MEVDAAGKMMNARCLIHQLPQELFAQIIHESLPHIRGCDSIYDLKSSTKEHYTFLYRLRGVSSAWRATIDFTPRLWTEISSGCHPKVLPNALHKSAQAGLHVTFTNPTRGQSWNPPVSTIASSDFLAQMRSNSNRWKTGIFHLSRESRELVQQYLTTAAPLLESVQVSLREGMEGDGPVNLFGGQADRLMDISLNSFPMRWDSQILRQVKNLEIVGSGMELKMSQLTTIVSNNLELRQLSIGVTDMELDGPTTCTSQISPARLETFRLLRMPVDTTKALLMRFDLPACRIMSIGLHKDPDVATRIYEWATRPFEGRRYPPPTAGSVSTVEATKLEFSLRPLWLLREIPRTNSSHGRPLIAFIFSNWKTESVVSWLETLVGECQIHLRLDTGKFVMHRENAKCLSESDIVDSISSDQQTHNHIALLSCLRRTCTFKNEKIIRRKFPKLKSITVTYSGSIDMELKDSLELRYDSESPAGEEGMQAVRPPDLKLDFRTVFGKPDYENARIFLGMDGIREVAVQGVPLGW